MNAKIRWEDQAQGLGWLGSLGQPFVAPTPVRPRVRWLSADGQFGLGATPWLVKKWYPERTEEEWNNLDEADKFTLQNQANAVEAKWNAAISQYKAEGACDATKPGRLAGALRAYLIAQGGVVENMGDQEDTFGPLECKEWMQVFNKQPDLAAAKASMQTFKGGMGTQTGTPTYGWKTIGISDICGSSVKLPVCAAPGGGPPPPKGVPCNVSNNCAPEQICVNGICVDCPVGQARDASGNCAVPKKTTASSETPWGLFALGASALAAIGLVFLKAPKMPAREADVARDNPWTRRRAA